MKSPVEIRPEQPGDGQPIHRIHAAAFPNDAKAQLVARLLAGGRLTASYLAEVEGEVVGHVAFSPVSIDGALTTVPGLGLGPVGILPDRQQQGIGTRLIAHALEQLRSAGTPFVVVLGDPDYYRRFGFQTASRHGLGNEYGADEEFMLLELRPQALGPIAGMVRYASEFAEL